MRLRNRIEALEGRAGVGGGIDTIERPIFVPGENGPQFTGDVYVQRVGQPGGEWVKREVVSE